MPAERVSMRQIRKVLRLRFASELPQRAIAVTAPAQVAAKHQSLLHFIGNAPWSDAAMLDKSLSSRKRGCASSCCR